MGYGANMSIENQTDIGLSLYISDVNCMYDGDHDGSNLSLFNNATVAANGSLPTNGTQYIEAKNSDSCAFQHSHFKLKIMTADGSLVSVITFTDSGEHWTSSRSSGSDDYVTIYINNSGKQATIEVSVVNRPQ